MAATNSKLSFAISYGLAGGDLHSKVLRRMLMNAGFTPAKKENADIIIAHSAGCWLIPPDAKPKLIVYVGMPLANDKPSQTWGRATLSGLVNNPPRRTIKIACKNAFYCLAQPKRNLNIIRSAAYSSPIIFKHTPTIFIANHYDPWPQSPKLDEYSKSQNWVFISLPGSHDDIWNHSGWYADIIKYYAKLLG